MRNPLRALLVVLVAMIPATVAHAADAPSARIDSVQVTPGRAGFVLTTANIPGKLDAKNVRVDADGTALPVTVTPVSSTSVTAAPPRAMVIVLDASGSMSGSGIAAARQAALSYVASLPSDVLAGLVTFNDRVRLAVAPTTDRARVRTALSQVTAAGDTSLYDAVHVAVSALDSAKLGPTAQRRLVVLSDGVDTSSRNTLASVTGKLSAERVPADVVAFRYGTGDASAAQQIASAAGGRTLAAQSAGELTAAFATVARNFTARARVDFAVPDKLAGRSVTLRATVGSVTAKKAVTFAPVTAPPTPQPTEAAAPPAPQRTIWTWELLALLTGVFLTVLLAVLLLRWRGVREESTRRLLEQVSHYGPHHEDSTDADNAAARTAVGFVDQVLRTSGAEEGLARRLDLADVQRKPGEWVVLTLCVGAVLSALATLLGLPVLLSVAMGVAISWLAQRVYLNIRISRRRTAFGEQLADVLQLIVGSLRSGFSLAQSVDAVVRDGTQPAAGEFSRALAETRIGVDLEDGLTHVAERMDSSDMHWVVMATRIQRGVGGNLAEVLSNTVETIRERAQIRRHVRAVSAEGRLSGYVLVALPLVLAAWLVLIKPEYMSPLVNSAAGIVMLAVGAGLIVVGGFWIRALIKVEA